MQQVALYLVFLLLTGCSVHKNSYRVEEEKLKDIEFLTQDVSAYINNFTNPRYIGSKKLYENSFFTPWIEKEKGFSKKQLLWPFESFHPKTSYGPNLRPLQRQFFTQMYEESAISAFKTINKKALSIVNTNIRALPTNKPLFLNPKRAGEGFPFDYLQNSIVAANKPLFVSHYSKSGEWVFVKSAFTYGWIQSRDIVIMENEEADDYLQSNKVFILKDAIALKSTNNKFLFHSRVGMLLRENNQKKEDTYSSLLIAQKNQNNLLYYTVSYIPKDAISKNILLFNKKNITQILRELQDEKYGWGGAYGYRDCSSTLRDFFAPFGLYLPRNSSKQRLVGKVISLEGLTDSQKLERIKQEGIPFETLLYKKGHILLYVGVKDNKVIVFHNTWGVKTKKDGKEGRYIIGKAIFSTLKIGSNLKNYDKDASILSNLKSMNILTQ
jgi:hypothetical protein